VSVASVPMNPVLIRMLTAAVLLAVFFPAVLLAPAWLWALLVSAVIMVGAHEWARLSQFPGSLPVVYAALVGLIALGLSFLPAADAQPVQAALFVLAALFWVVLAPLWLAFGWQGRAVFIRAAIGLTVLLPTLGGDSVSSRCGAVGADRHHGDRLDRRQRSVFLRARVWPPQAGAAHQPGQNLGGHCRSAAGAAAVWRADERIPVGGVASPCCF
jgi:hypothetical protein